MRKAGFLMWIALMLTGTAMAEDENRHSAATAAATGASAQVMTSAALDYATGSGTADTPAQTILKRAIVGAVTGAAATSMSKEPATNIQPNNPSAASDEKFEAAESAAAWGRGKKHKHKHKKDGHRPPGWDRGKKTGWGDSDVPPGLAKKD